MAQYQVYLTFESRNKKTGKMPVSTTTKKTCPKSCPFKKEGCYSNLGPLGMLWNAVTKKEKGMSWSRFVSEIASLPIGISWRHNQGGDLPGDGVTIDRKALDQLVKANRGKKGFTFSHYDTLKNKTNRAAIKKANKEGFRINLSANTLEHADSLAALNIAPVAVVLPSTVHGKQNISTPGNRRVVVCPQTYTENLTCKDCRLCDKERKVIIGFPGHGPQYKAVDSIIKSL